MADGTYEEVITHPIVKEIAKIHAENNGGLKGNIPMEEKRPSLTD